MTAKRAARVGIAIVACIFCALSIAAIPDTVIASEIAPAASTAASNSIEVPDISLLTFGPGEIYWERFGHNAILVRNGDDEDNAVAYNYGLFDFNQKNFLINFARGYMTYRMAADSLYMDLRMYEEEGRWVVVQHLDLEPAQRIALRDYLDWNAKPENTRYRYDYFRANCSTRVRDALDRVLGGTLQQQLQGRMTATTYRSEAVRLMAPDLWVALAMDVALGPAADRPLDLWQQSFVPMVFMDALRGIKVVAPDGRQHPLVDDERKILRGDLPEPPVAAPDLRLPSGLTGIAFAGILLLLARMRYVQTARVLLSTLACAFMLVCGIGGVILGVVWGFTEHWSGWYNENLLLLNPLCLFLLPGWITYARGDMRTQPRIQRLSAIVAFLAALTLVLKLFPMLGQSNLSWILLLLPPHLALALIAWHRRK